MSERIEARIDRSGWLLALGLVLALSGSAASRQDVDPQNFQPPSYATADSNDRMIAVTGIDVTGSSVLYVIDTIERRLSVYQADGGTRSTSGIKWVGARNIDLDFAVDGWNDKSELSFKQLRDQLESADVLPPTTR